MPNSTPILDYLWIIPALPLLGAAINGLFGAKWPNKIVNIVAIGSTGLSFLAALEAVREFFANGQVLVHKEFFTWIAAGNFRGDASGASSSIEPKRRSASRKDS